MKNVELRLIAELLRNSRRSDRELARVLGTSQPTVGRMIKKLKEAGIVKEFTMVPDFSKAGFEILALTFVKFSKMPSEEKVKELRNIAREFLGSNPIPTILVMGGMGMGYDRVIVSFHKDYSSYERFMKLSQQYSTADIAGMDSFLINLHDKSQYQTLTLASLAQYFQEQARA